jgi:hypothetical protein
MLLQCHYDKNDPSSPCVYCRRTGLSCGTKTFAPAREQAESLGRGEYATGPQSPGATRPRPSNPGFVANLPEPTTWHELPSTLSELARQLESNNLGQNIFQILELANDVVRRHRDLQATISRRSSIQQIQQGVANPGVPSPFSTQGISGSTREQGRNSGPARPPFVGTQWPQFPQAPSTHGSPSDNATPGSIQDRRVSQPQLSSQQQVASRHQVLPQHQVPLHHPYPTHSQGTPSPAVSFNNPNAGHIQAQLYPQSQPPFQAQHQPSSPNNLYPPPPASHQQSHSDNQSSGLSSPGAQSRGPAPSPTPEVNSTQTFEGWYLFDQPN